MKHRILFFALMFVLLSACNLPVATPIPPPASPAQTPRPTSSPVPPSPTPVQITLRVRGEKVNCRFGPGVVYAFVNELEEGQTARAIGRNESSTWWYIRDPGNPGGTCWVSAQMTEIEDGAENLPVIHPPLITVKDVTLKIEPLKIFVQCDQFPQTIFFEAEITADGPTFAVWRLESDTGYISTENLLVFEESGTLVVNGYYKVDLAGDHWIRLHILKPNDLAERLSFPANCTP
jgi:hypothetical protein